MTFDTARIGQLRRSLEPLAVLYEKVVLAHRNEPHEVSLLVRRNINHLEEKDTGTDTIHILDGESLRAAHELWQEFRSMERHVLSLPDNNDGAQVAIATTGLSEEESVWLRWYYALSENDQAFVRWCGDSNVSATPGNFPELKGSLYEQFRADPYREP